MVIMLCLNANKSLLEHHLNQSQTRIEIYCRSFEHLLIMDNFKANISEPKLTSVSTDFKLKNLVKEPTCYKNPKNPS